MASILVVDDEMGIRELLQEILTEEGHTVYPAESANPCAVTSSRGLLKLSQLR